jgi:tRNA G18 (ribose-2'-O)-methylase SpoU
VEPEWLSVLLAQVEERSDPWVLLEGQANVEAALAGWWEVPGVLVAEDHPWEAPVWSGLELFRKDPGEIEDLADSSAHGGILGLAKIPNETGDVAAFMKGLEAEALLVVCPRLDDPSSIGEIVRGAEAFDAAGVIFGAEGMSPFEPDAVRASGSTMFKLPIRIADGGMVLRCLLAGGFQLIGLDESPDAGAVEDLPVLASRRALVLGDEDGRLGRFWRSACSVRVRGDADTALSHLALA